MLNLYDTTVVNVLSVLCQVDSGAVDTVYVTDIIHADKRKMK